MVEGEGFEPTHPGETDLQSAAVHRLCSPSIICNTLRYAFRRRRKANEECVLKSTTHLRKQFDCSAVLFNTL